MAMGHIQVRFGTQRLPTFDQWFLNRFDYSRRMEVMLPDFSSVPNMLVGTNLVATMHGRLARLYARHLPLRLLPVPIEFPVLSEMMQWHRHFHRDPALIWFRSILHECVAEQEGV